MDEQRIVVTPDQARELDAQYRPMPTFADWGGVLSGMPAWDRRLAELDLLREEAEPKVLESALQTAMRAAAFDTGALEQLYRVDRGLTITVASEEPAWEQKVLDESGAEALDLFGAQLAGYNLIREIDAEAYPVTEAWIRRLHETLTAPQATYEVLLPDGTTGQRPLPKGAYRPTRTTCVAGMEPSTHSPL